jgi:hypothetical protein
MLSGLNAGVSIAQMIRQAGCRSQGEENFIIPPEITSQNNEIT